MYNLKKLPCITALLYKAQLPDIAPTDNSTSVKPCIYRGSLWKDYKSSIYFLP